MHNRKPYKIIDRKREVKKGVMAESLEELITRGKSFAAGKKYRDIKQDRTTFSLESAEIALQTLINWILKVHSLKTRLTESFKAHTEFETGKKN